MNRDPEPLEQIDYGANYKARGSAASHSEAHSEGGNTAMCIIALILAVMAFTLVAGRFLFEHDQKEDIIRLIDSKSKEAAAVSVVRSGDALQKAQVVEYRFQTVVAELKKHGIDVPTN